MREITDGCFCCRFESLIEAAESLTRDARPDVFLAEPVGSCTDLRATVQLPLARLYGDAYRVAPLSVLIDPLRAARAFGIDQGPSFSARVLYIYDKQLEEAEILVLNKVDIIPEELRAESRGDARRALSCRRGLQRERPQRLGRRALARPAAGDTGKHRAPDHGGELRRLCRRRVAAGLVERDARPSRRSGTSTATASSTGSAGALRERLAAAGVEIAHLKMTLAAGEGSDHATINLVRTDGTAELARRLAQPLRAGELTINLRAEDDPERLHALLTATVGEVGRDHTVETRLRDEAHFRPGRPVPTHRMAAT